MLDYFFIANSKEPLFVEDVFSTDLYTGNGSTQTVTNNINLSSKGGMVWFHHRTGSGDSVMYDTARGTSSRLIVSSTAGTSTLYPEFSSFNSNGFSFYNNIDGGYLNQNNNLYAAWTFRKSEKFFDVITYTGNGSARAIPHSLKATPGWIIVKQLNSTGNWFLYSSTLGSSMVLYFNTNGVMQAASNMWDNKEATSTEFYLGSNTSVNQNGSPYVAYVFANDTSTDSMIKCGTFTGSANGATVTLGWEPQFIIFKPTGIITGDWQILDTSRGIVNGMTAGFGADASIPGNSSGTEGSANYITLTPTGFTTNSTNTAINGSFDGSYAGYVYMAIRRGPMRNASDATKVFTALSGTYSSAQQLSTGFPVDMQIMTQKDKANYLDFWVNDRLRGVSTTTTASGNTLNLISGNAEITTAAVTQQWDNNGFKSTNYVATLPMVYWNFRRSPGFFETFTYTGDGVQGRTLPHGLKVKPDLVIIKQRNTDATDWYVWNSPIGSYFGSGWWLMYLNFNNSTVIRGWGNTTGLSAEPTSANIFLGNNTAVNGSGNSYVCYLFSSCPGVCKIGMYTGNGSSQDIDCGFSNGARFVLIRRMYTGGGNWYVFDTTRGIVAGNDATISLSTAAEATTADSIDPLSSGFTVNQVAATGLNASSALYLYWAIA